MNCRSLPLLLLSFFTWTGVARLADAADAPAESLLSADSVLYLRFDGLGSHQDAYERTIVAELLRDQFGPLVDDLTQRLLDLVGPQLLSERLLAGVAPDQLLKVQSAHKQLPHLLDAFRHNGVAVGVEVIQPVQARFQVTLVFPDRGHADDRAAVYGAFRLLGLLSELEVREQQVGERLVLRLEAPPPVKVACWEQDGHMVVTIGSEEIDHTLELAAGGRPNLTSTSLYAQLTSFDDYETIKRGFFDLQRLTDVARRSFPPAAAIVDQLGLQGLKHVRFHAGFQGEHVRMTTVLDVPGERQGLLRLLAGEGGVDVDQLPPVPPDAAALTATRLDVGSAYQAVIDAIKVGLSVTNPGAAADVQQQVDLLEKSLGIDLRKDLFANLGSQLVIYNAPSEGPFTLGMALAVPVKDEQQLAATLETLIRSLTATTSADVALREHEYRGARYYTVEVSEQGFAFVPTYAIHDGWLVFSFLPQTVQGFLYRAEGGHETWQVPELARRAIAAAQQEGSRLTGISISDPRPSVAQVLSLSPFLTKMIASFSGGTDFDVALIPNAQSVNDALTHNVTVVMDHGQQVQLDAYWSLPLPLQLTGMETYAYMVGFSFLFRFAF